MVDSVRVEAQVPNMIQELPWEQAKQSIKRGASFNDFAAFRPQMEDGLSYSSAETRQRYSQTIAKFFFPDASLETLSCRVWRAYQDDTLLEDMMRYQFVSQEPTVARFLATRLVPMQPGSILNPTVVTEFIQEVDPKGRGKMVKRLTQALRRLGFLVWERHQDVVALPSPSKTSLLLLVHHLFAPTPRIVRLADILANPFWSWLGFRDAETVRRILHEANARGLIANYATIDQLEQITTRYTLDQWLEQRLQL